MAHLALVSYRLGGSDGVSIEAAKWRGALHSIGHHVTTVAGEGDADVIIEGLALGSVAAPPSAQLRRALSGVDLVIVENVVSLPLNVAARDAVYEVIDGRSAILHHHDLSWQRDHLRHLEGPRTQVGWHHVTINELSRRELLERGVAAVTIMNAFDCNPPPGHRDQARALIDVDEERLALLASRALPRKNVAGALQLCAALDAVLWILGPAEEGYGPDLERLLERSGVDVRRGLPRELSIDDAYAACDLVVMPSTWEGFGNPILESVTHRRPLALYPYPVAREIAAFGFEFFALDDAEGIERFLRDGDDEMLADNLSIALEHFNLAALPERLGALVAATGVR